MPPVGGVLTDEQIAAVLTYIRREWGQTGIGRSIRRRSRPCGQLTAGRTRPWTNDELMALAGGRGGQRP